MDIEEMLPGIENPEAAAKGVKSMIDHGDRMLTSGGIVLAFVIRTEIQGAVVRVYTQPLLGVERGSTN